VTPLLHGIGCFQQAHRLDEFTVQEVSSTGPLKSTPSLGGSGPPSNAWFHGPTSVRPPNGIAIGSAIITQFTGVPNTQTDHVER